MSRAVRGVRLACCGALVGLAGCFSLARTQPVQEYFVLGAGTAAPDEARPPASSGHRVGVRRMKLASYLDSPFMVVRRGPNQVDFAEFQRWGEPLPAGIARVVAGALVARGVPEVDVAPWPAQARYDAVIQLDVVRFEGRAPDDPASADGEALVLATWEITRPQDGSVLARGTTDHRRPGWTVGDYAGLVTLLDEGLGVLADDLVAALAALAPVESEPR